MRGIIRGLFVTALGLGSVMAVTPSSNAATTPPGCDGSYFLCVYQLHDYEGDQLFTSQSNTNWDYLGNPAAFRNMNDKMSSVANTTSRTYAIVAQHDDLGGYQYCVTPGARRPNVNNDIENKSSSHKFVSSC